MVDVEHDHLGRAPRLAARLDRARRRVGAAHEGHRPGGVAALRQLLLGGAQPREVDARARPAAEDDALAPDPVEDRVHRVLDREDEARGALRLLLEPDVEPDRRVERRELVDEDRLQLVLEGLSLVLGGEVAAVTTPGADRADDAADHLLDRALALGARHAAAEILLRHDVGRGLRPELRKFDVLLLERGAVLAGDVRVAHLPLDLGERIAAGDREQPPDGEGGVLVDGMVDELVGVDLDGRFVLYGRHVLLFSPTNSSFWGVPAGVGEGPRRASLGTLWRGPDGAPRRPCDRVLDVPAARLHALRDQARSACCDQQQREPAEDQQWRRDRGRVVRADRAGEAAVVVSARLARRRRGRRRGGRRGAAAARAAPTGSTRARARRTAALLRRHERVVARRSCARSSAS